MKTKDLLYSNYGKFINADSDERLRISDLFVSIPEPPKEPKHERYYIKYSR